MLYALQDASLTYGRGRNKVLALQGVSLRIAPGERVALVGANGCGKSSLLRLLHGLLAPSTGTVERAVYLRQAMLFQRPFVLRMSVLRNLQLALWIAGQPWGQTRALAQAALQRVGLADLAGRNARHLSGGQQQRVALARAWALEPQVLLLDEPTASLDPHAKREVEALVEEFAHQSPTAALVFASHNLGQVKRLASRVVFLQQGCVLADLPVAEFFDREQVARHHPSLDAFLRGEAQ
ncbi:ATP-binding cassette domain-containing protein [Curvibacter sp. APW13]|nr:ATP-binding cassette domain-containing protein [Curvibacter sp. APW13]MDT8990697.1 ATP-binding cassette domain-containing protein [Curvibacter sp. APW13]